VRCGALQKQHQHAGFSGFSRVQAAANAFKHECRGLLYQHSYQQLMSFSINLTGLLLTCCCCCCCCCFGCLQELKQYQNADKQEIERLRRLFKDTTAVVWHVFGADACR
jgi:hypothetical protein